MNNVWRSARDRSRLTGIGGSGIAGRPAPEPVGPGCPPVNVTARTPGKSSRTTSKARDEVSRIYILLCINITALPLQLCLG